MNLELVTDPKVIIAEILTKFHAAKDSFVDLAIQCGRALVDALERTPGLREEIEKFPTSTRRIFDQLERIGRDQLIPQLVFNETPSVGRMALAKLPRSAQEHYLANPLPVLIVRGGAPDTLVVQLDNLTREQVSQVFARDHVRDAAEQRAWIESKASRAQPTTVVSPYAIKGRNLVVRAPITLSKSTLINLLAQMPD